MIHDIKMLKTFTDKLTRAPFLVAESLYFKIFYHKVFTFKYCILYFCLFHCPEFLLSWTIYIMFASGDWFFGSGLACDTSDD